MAEDRWPTMVAKVESGPTRNTTAEKVPDASDWKATRMILVENLMMCQEVRD